MTLTFPIWATLAGVPAGLALGWAVLRLWDEAPAHGAVGAWPSRSGRAPRRAASRCVKTLRAAFLAAVTLGAVLLGATHPAGPAGAAWPWSQTLLLYGLVVALGAVDLKSLLVDVRLAALGIAARVAGLGLFEPAALWEMGAGLLIGAGAFYLLGLFYEVLRRRQGLGEGDAAVAGLLGAFIGWQGLLPMTGLAAALGLLVTLPWLLSARRPATAPIPFVPFLGAAGLIVHLAQLHGLPLPWAP